MKGFGVLLVATLAWGALSFGAVYPWAYWPLAAASGLLGLWGFLSTRGWKDPRAKWLAVALAATVFAMFVQMIKLPYDWTASISPGLDRYMSASEIFYRAPADRPLSIDAGATGIALLLFAASAMLLLGTVRVIRRVRLEWLLVQIMGLGSGLALLGVIQKALIDKDAPALYGFWKPEYGAAPFGPFINRNHFAGWMVMVIPLVIGYAYAVLLDSDRPRGKGAARWFRWFVTVNGNRFAMAASVALMLAVSVVLTGSRSGIASLAVGLLVLGVFIGKSLHEKRARWIAGGSLAVLLAGALLWAGPETLVARFSDAPSEVEGRLSAWRDAQSIIQDFPVTGTGLGTFRRAMLVYQTADRRSMYAQAHNDYLQLAAEGGLLVGIPILLVIGLLIAGVLRRLRTTDDDQVTRWVRIGAIAGIAGIAAQSVVEFSLQMPGNMVLFVLLIAIALHRPERRAHHAYRV